MTTAIASATNDDQIENLSLRIAPNFILREEIRRLSPPANSLTGPNVRWLGRRQNAGTSLVVALPVIDGFSPSSQSVDSSNDSSNFWKRRLRVKLSVAWSQSVPDFR